MNTPLVSQTIGVNAQGLHQARSIALPLKNDGGQAADVFEVGAIRELAKGLARGSTELGFAVDNGQLHCKHRMDYSQLRGDAAEGRG